MSDEETIKLIRLAVSDPGAFLPRERWPDTSGIGKWEYESIPAWGARAVAKALAGRLLPPVVETREEHGWSDPLEGIVRRYWSYSNHGRYKNPDRVRTVSVFADGREFPSLWREVSP